MEWEMTLLDELQKMKEEMDRVWDGLFEEKPGGTEKEMWQWVERLPKFEGVGRKSSKSQSNRTIKF